MVPKERINRPKLYFKVIRLRIIFCHVKDYFLYPSFHLFFFLFFLWFSISLGFFFSTFVLLLLISIFFPMEWAQHLLELYLCAQLPLIIRHLTIHDSWRTSFFAFALNVGWSLVGVLKEIIRLKGETIG